MTACPSCGKRLTAPLSYAGRTLKCPQCEKLFPCVFDAGAEAAVPPGTPPPSRGFRLIEVADTEPKRSAAVELLRFGLGVAGASVGGIIGIVVWGIASALLGSVISIIGVPVVGGLTGIGMRLGYGRFGDFAGSGLAGIIGVAAFFLGWVVLADAAGGARGLAACAAFSGLLAGCISYGVGLDGNDID